MQNEKAHQNQVGAGGAGSSSVLLTKDPLFLQPRGAQTDNVLGVMSRMKKTVQTAS